MPCVKKSCSELQFKDLRPGMLLRIEHETVVFSNPMCTKCDPQPRMWWIGREDKFVTVIFPFPDLSEVCCSCMKTDQGFVWLLVLDGFGTTGFLSCDDNVSLIDNGISVIT